MLRKNFVSVKFSTARTFLVWNYTPLDYMCWPRLAEPSVKQDRDAIDLPQCGTRRVGHSVAKLGAEAAPSGPPDPNGVTRCGEEAAFSLRQRIAEVSPALVTFGDRGYFFGPFPSGRKAAPISLGLWQGG